MGGYMLDDGRKLQTHEYIEHLEQQLAGALFLSQEEREALVAVADGYRAMPSPYAEALSSARQKLEESLEGDSSNAI